MRKGLQTMDQTMWKKYRSSVLKDRKDVLGEYLFDKNKEAYPPHFIQITIQRNGCKMKTNITGKIGRIPLQTCQNSARII